MQYLLIAAFTVWFVDVVRLPTRFMQILCDKGLVFKMYYNHRIPRRIKPFDCVPCLSFWLALAYSIPGNLFYSVLIAAATSLGAWTLTLLINKLR